MVFQDLPNAATHLVQRYGENIVGKMEKYLSKYTFPNVSEKNVLILFMGFRVHAQIGLLTLINIGQPNKIISKLCKNYYCVEYI